MGFYKYNRDQLYLFGARIDERIPPKDKARFVVRFTAKLDHQKLLDRYSDQGNDAYPPEVMLAIWFYAYTNGLTSSRKLEECCQYDARYIYVSADLQPDHTTLSRFRKDHIDLFPQFFLEILLKARQAGISQFKDINIDSSRWKGNCSRKKSKNSKALKKEIQHIRQDIDNWLQRCESEAFPDHPDGDPPTEKQRLTAQEERLVALQDQLEERKKHLKAEHRTNHQINVTDPDARFMPNIRDVGYNAHAAVDSDSYLIVANEVCNEPNEQNHYSVMHEKCNESLGEAVSRTENLDSGYHSSEQLAYAEAHHADVVIADPTPQQRASSDRAGDMQVLLSEARRLHRSDFYYDAEADVYHCPAGKILRYDSDHCKPKWRGRIYQTEDCSGCPLLKQCLSQKNTALRRRIYRSNKEIYAERMRDKLQTPEAQERLKRRRCTVEPVFGNLKENLGFRSFRLRGLVKVKGEFNLMCIAHNLNILYDLLADKVLGAAIQAKYVPYRAQSVMSKIEYHLATIYQVLKRPRWEKIYGCGAV